MWRNLILLGAVAAGVLIGAMTGNIWPGIMLILSGLILRIYAGGSFSKNSSDLSKLIYLNRLHSVWPSLLLSGLAVLSASWQRPYPKSLPENITCGIVAEIIERSSSTDGERYRIQVNRVTLPDGEVLYCRNIESLLFTSETTVLEPGEIIDFRSIFVPASHRELYGVQYIVFDKIKVFDGKFSKNGKAIYHFEGRDIRIIGKRENPMVRAGQLRDAMIVMLEKSDLTAEASSLLIALLTGVRSGMGERQLDSFRDAGVVHTLAVSGMHVGIFSGILLWLTLPLNLIGGRKWRFIIAVGGAWVFTIFTGLELSTIRASLMLSVTALAWISGRRRNPFGALCMAAIVILLIWPRALWDVGFQLSFLSVAALCLLVEPLNPVERNAHPRLHSIISLLLATIVTTSVTWVISARYFGSMPLHFLTANLVIVPLLPVVMICGIVYSIMIMTGIDALWLAQGINTIINWLYRFVGSFTGTSVSVTPSLLSVIMWLCGVFILTVAIYINVPGYRMLPGARPLQNRCLTTGKHILSQPLMVGAVILFATAIIIELIRGYIE